MGEIIEIFDETKMRYLEKMMEGNHYSEISDSDMKKIEAGLIRFADEFAIAN